MTYVYVPMGRVRPAARRFRGRGLGADDGGSVDMGVDTSQTMDPNAGKDGPTAADAGSDSGSSWDWSSIITSGEKTAGQVLPGLFSWLTPRPSQPGGAPAPQTDYTPYVVAGVGLLAFLALRKKRA